MLGGHGYSMQVGDGHIFTRREHLCGEFVDTYDWPPDGQRRPKTLTVAPTARTASSANTPSPE